MQDWRYEKQLSEQANKYQTELTTFNNAVFAQAQNAIKRQQAAEKDSVENDAKLTKEKNDALAENERLRRSLLDSGNRLRIAGKCSAGSGIVHSATGTTSVGDAGPVELTEIAGRTVFDIRSGIISDQRALNALRMYVKTSARNEL